MRKLLPVERGFSPYRYVCDNLSALKAEYYRVGLEWVETGSEGSRYEMKRLLGTVEALLCVKEGFERNGWTQ